VEGPDTGENLASIVYTVLSELDIGAKLLQLQGTMPTIIQQWQKFLGVNNFYIPTGGIISTDIFMASMDFTNMNMNTVFFSWIISADISVLLKIYGYGYEYARYYPWGALPSGRIHCYASCSLLLCLHHHEFHHLFCRQSCFLY
jgi:hypothetical protein